MQKKESFFKKFTSTIERFLPMTLNSLVIFILVIYFFVLVGRSVWTNYQSNKSLDQEAQNIVSLENDIQQLKFENNYYQTSSYKEEQAREKLGYIAPGEHIVSVPFDSKQDKIADKEIGQVEIKTPNYRYWWQYFFGVSGA
jgi:cell division protein FtsB